MDNSGVSSQNEATVCPVKVYMAPSSRSSLSQLTGKTDMPTTHSAVAAHLHHLFIIFKVVILISF